MAAFDALKYNPKRLLYIVHESSILKKSLETFSMVLQNTMLIMVRRQASCCGIITVKLLKDPGYNQLGTYVYGKHVVIFASLKKDASVEERLNYKDKFLEPMLFQWECENNIRIPNYKA